MFKCLVMEIKDNIVIVMNDDGSMVRIRFKNGINVGDKIIYLKEDIINKKVKQFNYKPFMGIVALLMISILVYFNFKSISPYAEVSLDVNPSIKIELDENQNIIDIKGINKDGSSIDFTGIKGKNINDGILEIKQRLVEKNYILRGKSLLFGFAFVDTSENIQYEDRVKRVIKNTFNDNDVAFIKGDSNSISDSDKKGISLGRYSASLDFDDNKLEEIIENLTVDEILDAIKNKDKYIFWNAELQEEMMDELEDRFEEDKDSKDKADDDLEENEKQSNDDNKDDDLKDLD
ncbi:anti-sigma factor domain-containing protein [Clostridium septicum]|nr:anti-sigma factor domain-containing protein [Clostridium septicum]UEC19824.1 anti-sigma factor domain-containing protein [Clostridium septicum]USS02116.1 anti-sigma factor domain-containing protein [Clostridium septicum]